LLLMLKMVVMWLQGGLEILFMTCTVHSVHEMFKFYDEA
jgi:hypothetical protein